MVLVATVAAGCRADGDGTAKKEMPPVLVGTKEVTASTHVERRRFSGYTHPWEARGVGFLVGGRVTSIEVREGDSVRKGQLLATLDPEDYRLMKRLAEIQVEAIEPNFRRVDDLVGNKALPEAKLDELKGRYRAAMTQNRRAKRQVAYTRLTAPADGIVMERKTSVGQVIGQGMPAVVLLDLSRLKVKFGVTQQDLHLFAQGMDVSLSIPGIEEETKGNIHNISITPDLKTRTYEVVVEVDNSDARLRAGMLCHLHLTTEQATGIFVPLLALKHDRDNRPVVYTVSTETNKVVEKPVEPGRRFKDLVLIESGLDGGEELIVEGQGFVNPGDEVRTQ